MSVSDPHCFHTFQSVVFLCFVFLVFLCFGVLVFSAARGSDKTKPGIPRRVREESRRIPGGDDVMNVPRVFVEFSDSVQLFTPSSSLSPDRSKNSPRHPGETPPHHHHHHHHHHAVLERQNPPLSLSLSRR
ncbi:hypothetical protein NL108_018440 [Boleophthalmus pectinirostris]|nr:hypothetical protein NL108_018440 [Boleophthalmus pectinirostris]